MRWFGVLAAKASHILALGQPVQAQDKPSAQELADLRALAETGVPEAQFNLGVMYFTGDGVPEDDAEAVIWYRQAAEQGHADAQNLLESCAPSVKASHRMTLRPSPGTAKLLSRATPTRSSISESCTLTAKASHRMTPKPSLCTASPPWGNIVSAAEQGHAEAQFTLGVMYDTGKGVPRDNVEAHMWFNLAASRSSGEQRERTVTTRDAVAERMTPADLREAQRREREWYAAHDLAP